MFFTGLRCLKTDSGSVRPAAHDNRRFQFKGEISIVISYQNDTELFSLVREYLYTAVVGDIMDKMGLVHQFLPPQIRPLKDDMFLVGRAMTVLESDIEDITDERILNKPFGMMLEALDSLQEGEIYVCSGSSYRYALLGEIMTARLVYCKGAGAVLNGYLRDTKGILEQNVPVFSAGSYAQDQAPRGKVLDYRVPITFGDVVIHPGDLVIGDIDGVLTVPQDREKEIIQSAYEKATGEKNVAKAIRAGMPAAEAFSRFGIM